MMGIKYNMRLPVAAAAIFVALPYSISLIAQWFYGWPDKPGYKKYTEALKPWRIYRVTRAVLEMMKYLQYSKLYFQWKVWYKKTSSQHCVKDIPFGHSGNKLDLYHSPRLGQSETELVPVVVFVYGGAWGSGERSMYCLLALQMAKELNASVICPDYSIYPKGNVSKMVQDISDSLMWVRENGHSFGLDKDNIVLIGHSAGAHLCILTTVFLLEGAESLFIEPNKQKEMINSIKGIIGLSGVYNITDHYEHEKTRAVEYISAMHKAMDGTENFDYYSPTARIRKLNKDQIDRLPPVGLIHGTNDIIVPVESSVRLCELLTSLSVTATLYVLPNMNHSEVVTDLMAPGRHFYDTVFSCIKQEYRKCIGST
ncbi:probable isoprenylcysteine alpha-carbonyl methylesterase ICMEL2 isoform X2 [Silurus meridionalis]|nr:probable isoprenylcysteine alpha-carbonyl methylesterase ICMEL2 isoform X2 [Silurus meridionalis]